MRTLLAITIAIATALLACCCCATTGVFAVDYTINGNSQTISDLGTITELRLLSTTNAVVTVGPNVQVTDLVVSVLDNMELIFTDFTCTGSTFFSGFTGGSNLTVESSNFMTSLRLGPSSGATHMTFHNNTMTVASSTTTAALVRFTSSTDAAALTFTSNTMSITSSASGSVGCVYHVPQLMHGTDFTFANNTCTVSALNAVGVLADGSFNYSGAVNVSGNTFAVATSGTGASSCFRVVDFVGATALTGVGFSFDNNTCTSAGSTFAHGLRLETLQTNVSAPAITVSNNVMSVAASGAASTAVAVQLEYALVSSVPSVVSNNTIAVSANQDTAAIALDSGFGSSSSLDITGNTISVTNTAAGSSNTGVLRVTQGSAATSVSVGISSNTLSLAGAYAPGFIAVATAAVSGSWLLMNNTLTTSLSSALFSPNLDIASTGDFTVSCNTLGGSTLTAATVNGSLTNPTATAPAEISCGTCVWSLMCNQATTSEVQSVGGVCYCRCCNVYYADQWETMPRGTQCAGDAGVCLTTTVDPNYILNPPPVVADDPAVQLSEEETIGLSIACVVAAVLLVLLIWFCCCRGKKCCGAGGLDDDSDDDGEPRPVDPCYLPEVKTATDVMADRDDAAKQQYDFLAEADTEDGELAPNRPANPYLILSMPQDSTPERDLAARQSQMMTPR